MGNNNGFKYLLFLGAAAIASIVCIQSFWLIRSWDLKDQEFDISARIALNNVALGISKYNQAALPKTDLIQRRSSNIYSVNVNSKIDPIVIEDLLYQEMSKLSLLTDFEYAVYDCETDNLVYGNYCHVAEERSTPIQTNLPKFENQNYYFVVIFTSRSSYLVSNFWTNILIALMTVIATLIFIFLIFNLLKQRKLSVLQREFINNMTHEFKTPISSIKLATAALKKMDDVEENKSLEKYINIIEGQNDRLNDQIERVLRIATLDNNKYKIIDKIEIDLSSLVSEVVDNVKHKHTSHKFIVHNSKETKILGDKVHLTNIIYTILDNAVKYSPSDTEIAISLKDKDNSVYLAVSDQGLGIKTSEHTKIFDKFYRVSTGDQHDVKGFGLGLYYVKNICAAHGWDISVKSNEGEGSTFTIKIKN